MHDNLIILAGGMSSRMKKNSTSNSLSKEEEIQANERSKGLIGVVDVEQMINSNRLKTKKLPL